jgi:hypothetical protein
VRVTEVNVIVVAVVIVHVVGWLGLGGLLGCDVVGLGLFRLFVSFLGFCRAPHKRPGFVAS